MQDDERRTEWIDGCLAEVILPPPACFLVWPASRSGPWLRFRSCYRHAGVQHSGLCHHGLQA